MRYKTKNYTVKVGIDDLCFFSRDPEVKKKTVRQVLKDDLRFITWAINNLQNIQWSYSILEEYERLKSQSKASKTK